MTKEEQKAWLEGKRKELKEKLIANPYVTNEEVIGGIVDAVLDEEMMNMEEEIEQVAANLKERLHSYDDIGICYQFSYLQDDVWKKDDLFCLFAERLTRLIAMDVGVPFERIAFGKWGARLIIKEDVNNLQDRLKIAKWVCAIESHSSFKAFVETCKVATNGKTPEHGTDFNYFIEAIKNAFDSHFSYSDVISFSQFREIAENILQDAKENLTEEEYKDVCNLLNADLGWAKITGTGRIVKKNPLTRLF